MNAYGTIMMTISNGIIKIKTPTEDAAIPVQDEGANKSMVFYKTLTVVIKKQREKRLPLLETKSLDMLNSEKIGNEFYQNLGMLFYAVAMADNKIKPIEKVRLQKYVRQHWLDVDDVEDEFHTDAAYQIEIVFDWLEGEEKDSDEYFEAFKGFYKDHPEKFTPKSKVLIIETAESIAHAFAGKNKSEMLAIFKLKQLFNH